MATMKPLTKQSAVNGKWVGTCKICRLFLTDPEIWIEFHKKFEKGSKQVHLIDWLNAQLPEINANKDPEELIKSYSRENVTRHLKGMPSDGTTGHCRDFLACKDQIENGNHSKEFKESSKAMIMSPEIFAASDQLMGGVNDKLTEFLSLSQMVSSLESILAYYDKTLKERMIKNSPVTIEELESYQKQVTGLVKLKQDLSKLRNTSKIAGDAVESAIQLTTYAFIDKLIPITNEGKEIFQGEYPNSTLPGEVIGMILNRLKGEMQDVIPTILKKVLTEYKIK